MGGLTRRKFLHHLSGLAGLLIGIGGLRTSAGQEGQQTVWPKPEVRRSSLEVLIRDKVERLSQSAKVNLGREYTAQEKNELEGALMRDLESSAADIYTFVDP